MRNLIMLLIVLVAIPSFASIGIGVNYISDFWKADEVKNLSITLRDGNTATLTREAMANPSGLGIFLVFGISKFEAQVDAEYVSRKYQANLLRVTSSGPQTDHITALNSRIGLSGTMKYQMFGIPGVSVFAGVGAGMQLQAPVINAEFVTDVVTNQNEEFNLKASEVLKKSNISGFHIFVQGRIKPPAVPLGLQVTLRGLIMPDSKFERPSIVPNLMIGIGYFPF